MINIHDAIGNPTHPIFSPEIFMPYIGTVNSPFSQRLHRFFYNIWNRALFYWIVIPRMDTIARKYFGDDLPSISEIESQISLLLTTANPIMDTVRPNLPTVINIEQLHIDKRKPLPEVRQIYL